MPDPSHLPKKQRLALAGLAGAAQRLSWGRDREVPRDQALAELREITTDSFVLGVAMGSALAFVEIDKVPRYQSMVDLLAAAGADHEAAAEHLAWHWEEFHRLGHR